MPASGRMFLRSHQRHKDGKQHTYWSLVETVRTADGPRQRRLCYLDDSTLVRAAELKPCCGNHDRSFLLWCSPMRRSAARIAFSLIGRSCVLTLGKTYRRAFGREGNTRFVSGSSSRRMSTAWRAKGTMCNCRIFIRFAVIRHSAFSRSTSGHSARRNSPGRTNTSGGEPKRAFGHKIALISIDSPEQFRNTFRIGDGGAMLFFRWWERTFQIPGWIALGSAGSYSIPKHLSAVLQGPVGSLESASAFDSMQHGKHLGCLNFADGPLAEPGKISFSNRRKIRSP